MQVVISNILTNRIKKGSITSNRLKHRITICLKLYSSAQWDKEGEKRNKE